MLPAIETAFNVHGKKRKAVAVACGVGPDQLYKWFTGRAPIPMHRRQTIERALQQKIDWTQYQVEFAACNRPEQPANSIKADLATLPTKKPEQPAQEAKTATRSWFDDIAEVSFLAQ